MRALAVTARTALWASDRATIAWGAALLVSSLLVLSVLRSPIEAYLGRRLRSLEATKALDSWAFRGWSALAHRGYRASILAFVYAGVLAIACLLGAAYALTQSSQPRKLLDLHPEPGLPLAASLLLGPALALCVAGFLVILVGERWGPALGRSPGLRLLWLSGLALGWIVTAAVMPATRGTALAGAGVFAAAALLATAAPSPEGPGWRQVRKALARGRAEFSALALAHPPSRGEYLAPGAGGLLRAIYNTVYVRATVLASVRWDERGLEVTWWSGDVSRHGWDEIEGVSVTEHVRGRQGASVRLRDGAELEIPESGAGYRRLVSAVQARVLARERAPQ